MSTLLTFGSFDANDRVNTRLMKMKLGTPSRVAEELGGPGVDIARLGPVDMSALVESWFIIEISDTTLDGVTARVKDCAAELRDLASIIIGLSGSAYAVTLVPKIASCIEIPMEGTSPSMLINAHQTWVEVVVKREACMYSNSEALYTIEGYDLPAVIDLSMMKGIAAAPLDVEVTPPPYDFRAFWAGVYPDAAAVITDFVHEMYDKVWTGAGAAAEDEYGWPDHETNNLWTDGSGDLVYTSIDTNGLEPGEYLVIARCKTAPAHGDVFCGKSFVQAEMLTAHLGAETLTRYPLGIVTLPTQAVRGSEPAPLYIGMKSIGVGTMSINTVELIPVSWGMIGWRDPDSHCHALVYENELVYADDVGSLGHAVGDRQLRTLGGVIVATGERSITPGATLHSHWTISYFPRWEQFPDE